MTKEQMNNIPTWLLPQTVPLFVVVDKRSHTPWKNEANEAVAENRRKIYENVRKAKIPKL